MLRAGALDAAISDTPTLDRPRALTLHNPWAHAIAHCGKNVENRPWAPPAWLTELIIHAGKPWDSHALSVLARKGYYQGDVIAEAAPSAFVAVVQILGYCDQWRTCEHTKWSPLGDQWGVAEQIHWRIGKVWTLVKAVPVNRGAQRLWTPTPVKVEEIRAELPDKPTWELTS